MHLIDRQPRSRSRRVRDARRAQPIRARPPHTPIVNRLIFIRQNQRMPRAIRRHRPLPTIAVIHRANHHPILVLHRDSLSAIIQPTQRIPRTKNPHPTGNARIRRPSRRITRRVHDNFFIRQQQIRGRRTSIEIRKRKIHAIIKPPKRHIQRRRRDIRQLDKLRQSTGWIVHDFRNNDLLCEQRVR